MYMVNISCHGQQSLALPFQNINVALTFSLWSIPAVLFCRCWLLCHHKEILAITAYFMWNLWTSCFFGCKNSLCLISNSGIQENWFSYEEKKNYRLMKETWRRLANKNWWNNQNDKIFFLPFEAMVAYAKLFDYWIFQVWYHNTL